MKLSDLPGHARVWIYQSARELTEQEVSEMETLLDDFISNWSSHGAPLAAGSEIRYNRFLVLAVDEEQAKASGCSIDSSVHFIKNIEAHYGLDLFDRLNIAYKEDGAITSKKLFDFETDLKDGKLNESTIVFNNLVADVRSYMDSWEVPLSASWHARLLPN